MTLLVGLVVDVQAAHGRLACSKATDTDFDRVHAVASLLNLALTTIFNASFDAGAMSTLASFKVRFTLAEFLICQI